MKICVVGLGFGRQFVPIYEAHPEVEEVSICEANPAMKDLFPGRRFFDKFEDVVADRSIDAVHILTPPPLHVNQTVDALASGKHTACAVPMALRIDQMRSIIEIERATGLVYMMMETVVYSREYLYALELKKAGKFGPITLLRGDYYQDIATGYGAHWKHIPPMLYSTHALGPILAFAGTRATHVSCIGVKHGAKAGEDPFSIQIANFKLEGTEAIAQVNRSWYRVGRQCIEGFSFYGEKAAFECQQLSQEEPAYFELEEYVEGVRRWGTGQRVSPPNRTDLYPAELEPFANGWHGGSHPHLVHEFVSAIKEGRKSAIDAKTASDWCAAGIAANQSAQQNGAWVTVPRVDHLEDWSLKGSADF